MIKRVVAVMLMSCTLLMAVPFGASASWKMSNNKKSWVESGQHAVGWKFIDGRWYNFGYDGYAQTGWLLDNGQWYYMWSDGSMATESWLTNGGQWYYFDKDGKVVYDYATVGNRQYDFTAPAAISSKDIK